MQQIPKDLPTLGTFLPPPMTNTGFFLPCTKNSRQETELQDQMDLRSEVDQIVAREKHAMLLEADILSFTSDVLRS